MVGEETVVALRNLSGCVGESSLKMIVVAVTVLIPLTSLSLNQPRPDDGTSISAVPLIGERAARALDSMSNYFTKNAGQMNGLVRYYSMGNPSVAFRDDGVMFVLREGGEGKKETNGPRGTSSIFPAPGLTSQPPRRSVAYMVRFEGANKITPVGREELPFKSNFFFGNDTQGWRTDVPNFEEVAYEGLYEGVDLVYHRALGGVKYEFVVHPGADPGSIRLVYEGVDSLRIDHASLIAVTLLGEVYDSAPYSFQAGREVRCSFVMRSLGSYGFECEDWDRSTDLTIDPLVYSTFIGGSGFDSVRSSAVDSAGNVYVSGDTNSVDFPITPGSFDTSFNGGTCDSYVTKLHSSGSGPIYSTFLGGSQDELPEEIAVDQSGSVYVAGTTYSSDFPVTPGAFDIAFDGSVDAYITKLNAAGNSLVYSTFLGGNDTAYGASMAVDSAGNAYVVGGTSSADFPVTPGTFNTTPRGGNDLFVTKLSPTGSALVYSTFLGGTNFDCMLSVAIDPAGDAYVTGWTNSADFPVTVSAFDTSYNGGPSGLDDAFVTEINATGTGLVYSTFLGGSGSEGGYDIVADSLGNAYVTGFTNSSAFPVTPGAFDTSYNGAVDAFVTKLNSAGSALVFSTFLGGGDYDVGIGIALDDLGNVYAAGETYSVNFPTTPGAFDTGYNGNGDAFFSELMPDGTALVYSTYLGGDNEDGASSVAIDATGAVYLSGLTRSSNFPVTPGAFDTTFNGGDGFVTKLAFAVPPPVADLAVYPSDITLSPLPPYVDGATVRLNATIHNIGGNYTKSTTARFEDGVPPSPWIGTDQPLPPIPAGGSQNVSVTWTAEPPGTHVICVVADPDNVVYEMNETNNVACVSVEVTISLQLTPGHRFMSFPVAVTDDRIESVLSSIAGCYDYVRWYDPLDASDHWKSFVPGRTYNDLTRLDNTMGFWINVTAACTFTPLGAMPTSTTIDLHQGWNMIGFPSFKTTYTVADLKADIGLAGIIVEAFDAGAAPYYLQRVSDGYVMMAGEGYWLYVPSDATWTIDG